MSTNTNSTVPMQFPLNHNAYQNIGQAIVGGFSNNLRYCDIGQLTAEEFNTKIGSTQEMARPASELEDAEQDEALFGTHLREAVSTVKKLFKR